MMAVLYFFIVAHRTAAARMWLDTECARCLTLTTLTHFLSEYHDYMPLIS